MIFKLTLVDRNGDVIETVRPVQVEAADRDEARRKFAESGAVAFFACAHADHQFLERRNGRGYFADVYLYHCNDCGEDYAHVSGG